MAQAEPFVWFLLTVFVWFFVYLVSRKWEFNVQLRSQLFGLSPSDLNDEAYRDVLEKILPFRSVRNSRRNYTLISVILVVFISGVVACTRFRTVAGQILPPIVFSTIESPGESRYELVFWWSVFFAGALHLVPLLTALVSRRNPQAVSAQPTHTNPVLEVLDHFFAFQQFLLQRYLAELLQYRTAADEGSGWTSRRPNLGTISQMTKQRIASTMNKEGIDAEPFYHHLIESGDAKPVRSNSTPDNLNKLLIAIDAKGIPATRAAVGWRLERHGRRRMVSIGATGNVSGNHLTGFVMNVGTAADGRLFSSFIVRFPDPSRAMDLQIQSGKTEDLQLLTLGKDQLNPPVECRIVRTEWADQGRLYLACVAQNGTDLRRFSSAVCKSLCQDGWLRRRLKGPRSLSRES